ncbi:TlpA disulfide reductase family protein [Planctomycetota bacterium]|nr:TlpA disulfide reductase family protein [Planctomycetota bacterium]
MPSIQSFYEANKERGLHVFLVNSQGGTIDELSEYASKRGLTFPIPMDRGGFNNFPGDGGLPYAYVIGPDGKIAFQGRGNYKAEALKQLDRIVYKGLGKLSVAKECTKAATEFGKGNFGKARTEALKVKEKDADSETAVGDADFIIDRIDGKVKSLQAKVEAKKESRRYHEAVATLELLSSKAFKGLECYDTAATELKALKKDKEIKAELKAWDAFAKVLESNKKAKDSATKKKNLFKFYEKNEGMAAADEAKAMADSME